MSTETATFAENQATRDDQPNDISPFPAIILLWMLWIGTTLPSRNTGVVNVVEPLPNTLLNKASFTVRSVPGRLGMLHLMSPSGLSKVCALLTMLAGGPYAAIFPQ